MFKRKEKVFIYLVVFTSGAVILAIELAASRLLAPFFGSSIFVWANIIGIVLISLSLGYYAGGKIADQYPQRNVLLKIILIAGIITSFIPVIFKSLSIFIIRGLGGLEFSLILGSFLVIIFLFALPVFLLGMVSPFSIRLLTQELDKTGRVAGSLYAFSTLGSIIGTFGSAFLTIPFWGTKETIFFSSFLLILISVIGLFKKKPLYLLWLLLPIILYLFTHGGVIRAREGLVYEKDSPYQFVQIYQDDSRFNLVINNGLGVQSIYDPQNILVESYYDFFSLLPFLQSSSLDKKVLIIGLAGGTISRQYEYFFDSLFNLEMDGVEIDKTITQAAHEFFDLGSQKINVYNTDGRIFLAQTSKIYDIMVVDVYTQQVYIPFHLTTQEFYQEVSKHLSREGILGINVNAVSQESELLVRITQTIKSVFPYTYVVNVLESYNYIVLGSKEPLDLNHLSEKVNYRELKPLAREVENNYYQVFEVDSSKILKDNKAPVEILTEAMFLKFMIKELI